MSLRKVASSVAFCGARPPTNVSSPPASANATYKSQRHRSLLLAFPFSKCKTSSVRRENYSAVGVRKTTSVAHTLWRIVPICKRGLVPPRLCPPRLPLLFPLLFRRRQPPLAGNSTLLAEYQMRPSSAPLSLTLGQTNRP